MDFIFPSPASRWMRRTITVVLSLILFKWLADLVRAPHILDAVEDLIGPNILCWTTHWFIKEPRSPSYVSWHQDNNYWGLDTKDLVSVWICLLYTSDAADE